jgi:lauroyl/myristoyl acyltransferase
MNGPNANADPSFFPPPEAGTLHDVRWTRWMIWGAGWLPMRVCEFVAIPIAVIIYALAGPQRRAILSNLNALHPDETRWERWWSGARVCVQFAWTYLDSLWCLHHGRTCEWQVIGQDQAEALRDENGGALLFTVHAGAYDIGSALFASHLGRELHTVRLPERSRALDDLRRAEFDLQEAQHPLRKVHYNDSQQHLGLLLTQLLRDGKLVGVQGDRAIGDVVPFTVPHGACLYTIPKGPLVLAEMTRVPCYAVFLRRVRRMTYEVTVRPPFALRGEKVGMPDLSQRWLTEMSRFLTAHWDQWYVFEPIVQPAPAHD